MSAHSNPVRTILPFLACAAFLFAMPRVASAQRTCTSDGGACTYNGVTFTMADLRKFAPEVQFHAAERFFPAGIDWILDRATQVDAAGHARTGGGSPQQRMADHPDDRLIIDSAAFGGMPPDNGFSPAPMYVAVQVPDHRRWVDLHYVMLFPFNGPQTYRFLSGGGFNFFGRTIGEHQGDLEMVTVRVAADFSEVLSVRFENHGNSKHFFPAQVTFDQDATGTHPFVSSALHSHGTWNPSAYGTEDWESTNQNFLGGVIDLFGSDLPGRTESGAFDQFVGGPGADVRWRPWDANTGASLTLIGLDADGQPVNDQVWARFAGRIGAEQVNAVTDVFAIGVGAGGNPVSLTGAQRDQAMFMLTFPINLSLLLDQEHAGPEGPGFRDWIRPPASTTVYLRSRVGNSLDGDAFNLFLTAGTFFGAGVESRSAMCSTSQLWEVSTWPASADGKAGTTGLALLNRRTRGLLEYRGRRTPVNATLPLATSHLSGVTLWSLGAPEPFYVDQQQPANLPPGYAFSAFRPVSDTESNLNVFTANDRTANPGTTVGVWDWGVCGYPFPPFLPFAFPAGCPNNIWRFEEASCPLIEPPTSSVFFWPQGANGWLVGDPAQVYVDGYGAADAIRLQFDNGSIDLYSGSTVIQNVFGQGDHSLSFGASNFAEDLHEPMRQVSFKIDSIPPQIFVWSRSPSPNGFGWNNSPVHFDFICYDERSGVASCGPPQTLSFDGKAQAVRGVAFDVAGNLSFLNLSDINIDQIPPSVTAVMAPSPNAFGWNKTSVTVTTKATDALSGIGFQNTPTYSFPNEGFFGFFGSATDKAGNSGSVSGNVWVDRTPPVLNAFVNPPPNAAGWNKTPVTVRASAFDTLSGIDFASQPPQQAVSVDTAGFSVIMTTKDRADNASSVTTVVRIDRVPPIVTASVAPSPNAQGWINAPATVSVAATDALSGIAFTSEPQVVSIDSDGFSVVATARDRADNESSVTTVVRVDRTAPSLSAVVAPSPNAGGWNKTPVTVSAIASDALSGIAFVSDPQMVSNETAGFAVVDKARDHADNESSVTTDVRIDLTPPMVSAVVSPLPNPEGWNNTPATVSAVAADALSGIAFASDPVTVSGDTAGFPVIDRARDRADNESSVTTVVRLDQTPPGIAAVVSPPPNAQGWNHTPVVVSVLASDALSGIASTSGPVAVNGDVAGYQVVGTAIDKAGNVSIVATTISIDHVAPELYLEFDAGNDEVALFARDAASGVAPSALTPASAVERCNDSDWGGGGHDGDADDEDESNPCHGQKTGERRTYSVPDNAGNLIEVVVDVLVHHDHVRARFVSIGYNGGAAAPVRRNIASFKTHSGPSKPLDVDQQFRLWFDEFTDHVNAKFEEKKGTTTIKSVRSGQTTNTVRSGRVLLKLATATGMLAIEY